MCPLDNANELLLCIVADHLVLIKSRSIDSFGITIIRELDVIDICPMRSALRKGVSGVKWLLLAWLAGTFMMWFQST